MSFTQRRRQNILKLSPTTSPSNPGWARRTWPLSSLLWNGCVRLHIVTQSSGAQIFGESVSNAFHTPSYSERLAGLFKFWLLHTIDADRSIGWAGSNQALERDGSLRLTPLSLRR